MRFRGVLFLILLLAAALRFKGIGWGIPSVEIPHVPLHPDESWAMDALHSVTFSWGNYSPSESYREGALLANLWLVLAGGLKAIGVLDKLPYQIVLGDVDYGKYLLAGRCLNVLFELGSVVIISLVVRKIAGGRILGALLAAFAFAILPFEVIYSHFLRAHTASNFFALLVIYSCLFLKDVKSATSVQVRIVGLFLGLAVAARYTSVFLIILPALFLLSENFFQNALKRLTGKVFWRIQGAIFGYALLGFLITEPNFLIRLPWVRGQILHQMSFAPQSQFTGLGLFDLSRVWVYLEHLVPYAALPALWALFYGSIFYLLLVRTKSSLVYPLLVFLFGYFIIMSKGYLETPTFIRASILTFPFFAILTGVALDDLFEKIGSRKFLFLTVMLGVGTVYSTTLFYTTTYVRAMAQEPPQISIYRRLLPEALASIKSPLKVGYYPWFTDYFAMKPALNLIPQNSMQLIEAEEFTQAGGTKVDYVIIGAYGQAEVESRIKTLVESGKFYPPEVFQTELSFMGVKFEYPRNPPDLVYPFPKLYLLKAKT